MGQFGQIWDKIGTKLGKNGTKWDKMELNGTKRDKNETKWDKMELTGTKWDKMGQK